MTRNKMPMLDNALSSDQSPKPFAEESFAELSSERNRL